MKLSYVLGKLWQAKWYLTVLVLALTLVLGPWISIEYGFYLLGKSHPKEALTYLQWGLKVFPWWKTARIQACHAARQSGQFDIAFEHLSVLEQEGSDFENEGPVIWAMIHASRGELPMVENKLIETWNRNRTNGSEIACALAEGYLRMFRLPDALAITGEWIQNDPHSIRAHVLRADTWYRARSPDNAVPALQEVIERDPTQTESRFHLALALLDKARYDEALDHLNLVAKAWPENTLVTCRQARALFMLGREKQARSMLSQQLTQYPRDAKLLSTMGQLDLLSGRNEEAIQFFKNALSLVPSDYQSLYSLSQALNRLGNKEESQKYAKEAERIKAKLERLNDITSNEIALKPLDPAIHEELGRLYTETGQLESARAWLESSLRLDPQRENAKLELQKVLEKIGQS